MNTNNPLNVIACHIDGMEDEAAIEYLAFEITNDLLIQLFDYTYMAYIEFDVFKIAFHRISMEMRYRLEVGKFYKNDDFLAF